MKLVSLCPSLTELVFALERGEDLVGVTRFCVHPAEGVVLLEKVGGTKDPDVARIVALAPGWHGSRTPDGIDYAAGLVDRTRGRVAGITRSDP